MESSGPMHLVCMMRISFSVARRIFGFESAAPDIYFERFVMVVLKIRSPFANIPFIFRSSVISAKPCSIASFALSKFISCPL